jgi:hypothetical protein
MAMIQPAELEANSTHEMDASNRIITSYGAEKSADAGCMDFLLDLHRATLTSRFHGVSRATSRFWCQANRTTTGSLSEPIKLQKYRGKYRSRDNSTRA